MTRHQALFSTVKSEGGLLPTDVLKLIVQGGGSFGGCTGADYHLANGDEFGARITDSWSRLRAAWKDFALRLSQLPDNDSGTSLTRDRWLLVLFEVLGYGRLPLQRALNIDGKDFPISHCWGRTPIHLVSAKMPIDRRTPGAKGAAGASPHSLMQELLNRSSDHLWGFVSNGRVLRVLRDNVLFTRQAYIEFDLETMFADEVFEDFVVLWRICHQSRVEAEDPTQCWLERWTHVAAQTGMRVRDDLRGGVESAIECLGTGFVSHPSNTLLRELLRSGDLDSQDFYRQLLRVVYRLLFLFVAEDRRLLHPPETSVHAQQRYTRYYSLQRLRGLASRRRGGPHPDLWASVKVVFGGLGQPDGRPELALPGLGSFLWSDQACPELDRSEIANHHLLEAVRRLSYVEDRNDRVLRPIDYRNLGTEELGAVYEALLEQHPEVNTDAGTFALNTAAGHERKSTGSYYTPPSIIHHTMAESVERSLDEAVRHSDAESALLRLKVIDPACGSGHFLIAATHRIAKRLAAVRTGDDEPSPDATRTAVRDVIAHCIYGIDLNPMAVELCKVSLWMESMEPGKPLGFLDHRILHGNGVLGATPEVLSGGVPDEAFKAVTGDDKSTLATVRKINKSAHAGQFSLFDGLSSGPDVISDRFAAIEALDVDTFADVQIKARRWTEAAMSEDYLAAVHAADTWCAAFVSLKAAGHQAVTEQEFVTARDNSSGVDPEVRCAVTDLSERYSFLHWHLAFPEVYAQGGFDLVIGNPPFLNQLELASALDLRSKNLLSFLAPGAIAGYTDLSAAFLAVWVSRVRPGGRIAMVQPISLMATRDASGTRQLLARLGSLESLWVADSHMFDAAVYVCVPVVVVRKQAVNMVRRFVGEDFRPLEIREVNELQACETWAELMTDALSGTTSSAVLGDVCAITADFRDQYYGLIPFVLEDDGVPGRPRLLTTGLVDPAHILWGEHHTRFGKQRWELPVVNLEALHSGGELSKWASDRLVPKILVASQTKVIEAVADPDGTYLPSVPLLTLIPHDAEMMWKILAVLLSPYASYWAHSKFQGAGMSADAIKVSAKQLASLPLPIDSPDWKRASEFAREASKATTREERDTQLIELGRAMNQAYQCDGELLEWWMNRVGVMHASS